MTILPWCAGKAIGRTASLLAKRMCDPIDAKRPRFQEARFESTHRGRSKSDFIYLGRAYVLDSSGHRGRGCWRGSDICRRLASEGYRVVVADFDLDRAQGVLDSLEDGGHEAIHVDETEEETMRAAVDAIEADAPARILVIASDAPSSISANA